MNRMNASPDTLHRSLSTWWLRAAAVLAAMVLHAAAVGAQTTATAVVTTPQVRAELVAHAPQGVKAGSPLMLGLLLQHQPGWHTYWLNAGDSGLATQLNWTLPKGMSAGPTVWPTPRMIRVANMVNHGYEDQVLLATEVKVAANPGPLATEVMLRADWLVCKQECIPQSGEFVLKLPAQSSIATHAMAFEGLMAQQPTPLKPALQTAQVSDSGLAIQLRGLPARVKDQPLLAYAETPEVLASGLGLAGSAVQGSWQGDVWQMQAPLHAFRHSEPSTLNLLLVDEAGAQSWRVGLKIEGRWPAEVKAASPAPSSAAASSTSTTNAASPASDWALLSALLGAFIGGLLLNLMPCVLPVLAIKLLSLTQQQVTPAMRRGIGLGYTAGVMLSMLGLAALVLGLRAAGQQLGWGFQLQSPTMVIALSVLFTLIALNLFGVLEMRGAWASGLAAQLARHPLADAFLSGVLAVVVAAPCTAPFMGASVGLAFTLPVAQALLIFLCLGLGLALPFGLVCWWPVAAEWLPRPGAWMVMLRQALGFPMLATVVWLVWVLGQQTSIDASAILLAALVVGSGLTWALGLQTKGKTWVTVVFAAVLAWLLWVWGPVMTREAPAPIGSSQAANTGTWQAWSPEKVNQALANGQPVFVDFTAAWCVTCQVNKQSTLRNPQVLQAFADKNVLLLQADWTRQDPAISAALNALGRSGVPVYLLQAPGKEPQLLSELLSPTLVMQALAGL